MRHDYELPSDYERRVEAGEMVEWYTRERTRRQAMRQDTPWSRLVEAAVEREERRRSARPGTTSVDR